MIVKKNLRVLQHPEVDTSAIFNRETDNRAGSSSNLEEPNRLVQNATWCWMRKMWALLLPASPCQLV